MPGLQPPEEPRRASSSTHPAKNSAPAEESRAGGDAPVNGPKSSHDRLAPRKLAPDAQTRQRGTIARQSLQTVALVIAIVIMSIVAGVLLTRFAGQSPNRSAGTPAAPSDHAAERANRDSRTLARPSPTDSLKPGAPTAANKTEVETRGGSAYREAPARGARAQTRLERSRVDAPSSPLLPHEVGNLPPVAAVAPLNPTAAPVEIPSIKVGGTEPVATLPPAREMNSLSSPRRLFEKESTALERVLASYEQAYNRLDVTAALAIWPSADSRALAKAFARLQQQDLKFENCTFAVSENDGTAQCGGVLQYVRRIGKPTPQLEHHVWTIEFARAGAAWRIVRVTAQ
jgi:hypothetical protein